MSTKKEIEEHHEECEKNKKEFGQGPWSDEPNRVQWERNGMPCLAVRSPRVGSWCGYVGLSPGHKYYGIKNSPGYDEEGNRTEGVYAYNLSLGHGGITYSGFCQGNICHATSSGDKIFWLGFDCAHSMDFTPNSRKYGFQREGDHGCTYKDLAYVKRCVDEMADELRDIK